VKEKQSLKKKKFKKEKKKFAYRDYLTSK